MNKTYFKEYNIGDTINVSPILYEVKLSNKEIINIEYFKKFLDDLKNKKIKEDVLFKNSIENTNKVILWLFFKYFVYHSNTFHFSYNLPFEIDKKEIKLNLAYCFPLDIIYVFKIIECLKDYMECLLYDRDFYKNEDINLNSLMDICYRYIKDVDINKYKEKFGKILCQNLFVTELMNDLNILLSYLNHLSINKFKDNKNFYLIIMNPIPQIFYGIDNLKFLINEEDLSYKDAILYNM